jgi:hypothetical protein
MSPQNQFHPSLPNIALQLQAYTVYTVFTTFIQEANMSTKKPASTPAKTSEKSSAYSAAKTPGEASLKLAKKKLKKNSAKKERPEKKPKAKVIRKNFAMPKDEYQKISEIKKTCLKTGLAVKKNEVLRAGLKALCGMTNEQLKQAMSGLGKNKGSGKKS